VRKDFQDPRSFWRDTPDATFVLDAIINATDPQIEQGVIPDGLSNIFYDDNSPLSITFKVQGNEWGPTRDYHAAAFHYYDAISAKDINSKRESLGKAAERITGRCTQ